MKKKAGMKTTWKIIAWLFAICGIAAYAMGWASLLTGFVLWNVPAEFWFYDAAAAALFAIFFLVYSMQNGQKKG